MNEIEKVTITKTEHHALSMIRGLSEDAHYMVILAKQGSSGRYILEGKEQAFDNLATDLSDEIFYELSPKSRLKTLNRVYDKVAPECEDY